MPPRLDRRRFLRLVAVTAAASATPLLKACSDAKGASGPSSPEEIDRVFPQGLASGDPDPGSVLLWTRVAGDLEAAGAAVEVDWEVALDEDFRQVVAEGSFATDEARDWTVKLEITGLQPLTRYFYRFHALSVTTEAGRTLTAPGPDQDVPVRFAFASCQDFAGRYYHAWRALVEQEDPVDFVVFLGDYVYETAGDPRFQDPTAEREIRLPDGQPAGPGEESGIAASTLADYRSLYRQYRRDPWLRRAHQLFPFYTTWDDHEFSDDCWGANATYFGDLQDEFQPARRQAADQAWFEYQPARVSFDATASFPDDIRIYRNFRYGRHLQLFLADERYYRDDHVIPEGPLDLGVGKFTANSSLGSRNFVLKSGFDPREAQTRPTLLGATQKSELVAAIRSSSSTWKILANEVQLGQMLLDLSGFPAVPAQFRDRFYFSCDQWDGYRSERRELLEALDGVENLVAITGDIHAFYASELHPDFDAPGPRPVGVEYVVAGISSSSLQSIVQTTVDGNATLSALGLSALVPQLDEILSRANGSHLRYARSLANGIAVLDLDRDREIVVTFLIVEDVRAAEPPPGPLPRVRFRTRAGDNRVERIA